MKIIIIGAMGRVGQYLCQYALDAGHRVTAFSRSVDKATFRHEHLTYFRGDALYLTALEEALPGHDAVISVMGVRQYAGPSDILARAMQNVTEVMQQYKIKRILNVGGAGVLQLSPGVLRRESPDFPPFLQHVSNDHLEVYECLKRSNLDWTVVAPPFMVDGVRTGHYLLREDYFPEHAQNQISVQDVADFLLKEAEASRYLHHRVGIAYPLLSEAHYEQELGI